MFQISCIFLCTEEGSGDEEPQLISQPLQIPRHFQLQLLICSEVHQRTDKAANPVD